MTRYLSDKYAARPPHAIVVVNDPRRSSFLLRHRASCSRALRVVHAVVSKSFLRSVPPLPADVVGSSHGVRIRGHRRTGAALAPARAPACLS